MEYSALRGAFIIMIMYSISLPFIGRSVYRTVDGHQFSNTKYCTVDSRRFSNTVAPSKQHMSLIEYA